MDLLHRENVWPGTPAHAGAGQTFKGNRGSHPEPCCRKRCRTPQRQEERRESSFSLLWIRLFVWWSSVATSISISLCVLPVSAVRSVPVLLHGSGSFHPSPATLTGSFHACHVDYNNHLCRSCDGCLRLAEVSRAASQQRCQSASGPRSLVGLVAAEIKLNRV